MNNIRLRKLQKVNMLQIYWDRQEASGIKTKIRAECKNELGGHKQKLSFSNQLLFPLIGK